MSPFNASEGQICYRRRTVQYAIIYTSLCLPKHPIPAVDLDRLLFKNSAASGLSIRTGLVPTNDHEARKAACYSVEMQSLMSVRYILREPVTPILNLINSMLNFRPNSALTRQQLVPGGFQLYRHPLWTQATHP